MPDTAAHEKSGRPDGHLVRGERLHALQAALPADLAFSICVALLLVMVLWPLFPPLILAGWLGTLLLVSGGRLLLARRGPDPRRAPAAAVDRRLRYTFLGALCSGIVWGAAGILLFPPHEPVYQAYLVIALICIAAGAVTNLSSVWPVALAICTPVLGPLIVRYLVIDTPLSLPLAALLTLMLLGMAYMSHRLGRKSDANIRQRMQMLHQRDALQQQERRYRSLVESTSAILWEGDPETLRFTFVSGEAETLLGHPASRWSEDPTFWRDRLHPDDAEWVPDHYARAIADGRRHSLDYRVIAADGRIVWLRDTVTPIMDEGRAIHLVGVMTDITHGKESELRLRQQEEHYRTLVESTSAIFWEEDPETLTFTFVSHEAENILGYPVEAWQTSRRFWLDHMHPDDRAWVPQRYEETFRERRRCSHDYRMIAADGSVVWLRDVATVLMEDGRPVKNVGVMLDITEAREAESAVEYLSGLQRTLVEVSRRLLVEGPEGSGRVLDETLSRIGAYCRVDRSYLFRHDRDARALVNTHEWCADGIAQRIHAAESLARDATPMLADTMERQEVLHVPRVTDLDEGWAGERAAMEARGIQSMVAVPVVGGETVYGFIGFDSVRRERAWSDAEIRLLRVMGDLVGAAIARDEVTHALVESETLRSHAEALAHLGSWEWDLAHDVFTASEEWRRVTGCHEKHLTRESVVGLAHPDERAAIHAAIDHTLDSGEPYELEHRIVRPESGEVRWIQAHAEPIYEHGVPIRLYGFIQDTTERRLAEEAVAESEARYRSVVNGISEVVYRTDAEGNYTFLNPAWEEITGYSIDATLGTHFLNYVHPEDRSYSESKFKTLVGGDSDFHHLEVRHVTHTGTVRWIGVHARSITDERGRFNGCTGTLRDITEKREAEEKMAHLAHYDPLTDLPNRMLAMDRLNQAMKTAQRCGTRVAALYIDLDNFKKVNDTLGHESGDELLVQAGARLLETVRDDDTVARLGGDEFLVILSGLKDSSDVQPAVHNMLERIRDPFMIEERELVLTASIGIAIAPIDGTTTEALLRHADTAMYHSKYEGHDTFHFFTSAMNREVARRLSLEEQLRGALAREEIHVVYQPLVDLRNRRIIGAEALLRWHNEVLGEVEPDEFIPVAEQTGLINSIGEHVLEQALGNVAAWRNTCGRMLRVSVNVSPQQFRHADLVARIDELLARFDLPGDALAVEVTEGVLLSGRNEAGPLLEGLRSLGVGIAMDDFGTGYSSLSNLRQYPFDAVKIDKSFVRDITEDANDRELVVTTLRLARGLELTAIAEGIETREQLAMLLAHDCPIAQGHLFSRPVEPTRFPGLLADTCIPETPALREG